MPSLPGFAFSNPITRFIGPCRAADLMHKLMSRLFDQAHYIVQGGDWGSTIASWMAYLNPEALLGLHINMASIHAEDVVPTTEEERQWQARREVNLDREGAYSQVQATRAQTLGMALADSPVGAAAWIMEKFGMWADLPMTADGSPDIWSAFTEDDLLTNIMLYIAPAAVVTATWIYRGQRLEGSYHFPGGTYIRVPTGIAAFPDPVFLPPPRSFAEKTYNVLHWSKMERGGHFAALEEPERMLADFRAFISTVSAARDGVAFNPTRNGRRY